MAKKNRDLFEILGSRSGAAASGIVQRVQDVVSPKSKKSARSRKGRSSQASSQAGISSVVLAAVGFGALAIGFIAGRWSSAAPAPVEQLNRTASLGERGARPGPMRATALSGEKLTERLSQYGYVLLWFPILDADDGESEAFQDAKRLVEWLREREFFDVRLRRMGASKSDKEYWVVVDYVDSPDDTAEYERLRALESPAFAPDLAKWIEKRNKPKSF